MTDQTTPRRQAGWNADKLADDQVAHATSTIHQVDLLRGVADAINRRQPRPTPKQRRLWADALWAIADALDVISAQQ